MRNGRRKQFGILQANIIYLTVCCIFLSYKNENPYSAFTTETSIWNQRYPSQSISICFPKIWLTLGKSFLPLGPLFPHLQSAWAARWHSSCLPSHRTRLIQVFFRLSDFPSAFTFQRFFVLHWCFQIILYWWSQNISPSFYCLIAKKVLKIRQGGDLTHCHSTAKLWSGNIPSDTNILKQRWKPIWKRQK